ncbi:hypothetical protein [Microbacterium sp. NPDC079176]|uniref:hypothetical protein n=1 Tax=Microbacterium sp. NPDC079176 TaxID=3154768 RepID=UPI0034127658
MTDTGIIVSVIALLSGVILALIAFWRFRRKDRADAQQVEEGTISGRFKDADALMRYIDERVEERTAHLSAELAQVRLDLRTVGKESHEMHDAVRARETQLWLWNHRGRPGDLPMLPEPILRRLGLGHMVGDDWPTQPLNPKT